MVLILVLMERGCPYYTLVANIGVSGILYRKSRKGVVTPSEDVLQKIPQEDEG